MFLNFGKKNSIKKPASPVESPKTASPLGGSSPMSGSNLSSRSTVQTTAGPLLSSSRFNSILDASTYANVNSPGFTSRVVNCASNRGATYHDNSETYQSRYSSVGLFPSVQLRGLSILPSLTPRNSQKVKTPVRVRIAPPSFIDRRRHSISVPAKVIQDKTDLSKRSPSSPLQSRESSTKSCVNGISVPNNQDASRKRIFSECQDTCQDEAKKRRRKANTAIPNPNNDTYHYRHVRAPAVPSSLPQSDNASQGKRAREKGSPEEQKRQRRKVSNTNNAIFSSLSSSRNLLERLSAQKRKSVDTSRSSSPLTPLSGKQVKESKTVTNTKVVQCDLDSAPQLVKQPLGELNQQDGTPVSSKAITKRATSNAKESCDNPVKSSSPQTSTCDYTTKLFRKEVSNTPRTQTSKTPKQSLWVRAPEADELTCSLLNDDSKLHRPERLRSLLACVSGKDNKTEGNATVVSKSTSTASTSVSLPVSPSLKPLSPSVVNLSSALTVTVSSTSTIMTSATVTSVNGVPSSESGRSPPPLSVLSSSFPLSTLPVTSITSPLVQSSAKVPSSLPALPAANLGQAASVSVGSQLSVTVAQVAASSVPSFGSSNSLAPSAGFSVNGSGTATLNTSEGVKTAPNMFNLTSPLSSYGSSQIAVSAEASKPPFQLGNGTINATTASSMFQFGSNVQSPKVQPSTSTPSTAANSTFQFASGQTNLTSSLMLGSTASAPKPAVSFGSSGLNSSGSGDPKPAFAFGGATKSTGIETTATSKPALSFGSSASVSSEAPKPAFQFNSSGSGISETAKSSFQFNSSGAINNGLTGTPKSTPQLGSAGNGLSMPSKPTFQFGSLAASSSSSPAPQFGSPAASIASNSEAQKSTFQFGAAGTAPQFGSPAASIASNSEAQKSTFQFGSAGTASNSVANAPRGGFQFGSGSNGPSAAFQFSQTSSNTSQPPSFGSTNNGLASASKPAFAFGASGNGSTGNASSAFQFASSTATSADTTKSAFQFSSGVNKPTDLSTPTFGSPPQGSNSAFGQVAAQQPKAAFAFGSSASVITNGSSGNEGKSAFSFGSSAPAFSSTSASSPFGSGPIPPAFGAPAPKAQSALPSFGSLTDAKSNGFGPASSFGSTAGSSAFAFSSPGTGNSFSLGGPGAGSSSGAFSFGQSQDQAPSAFNFNASIMAVPNPAQDPGLFSVGAGATPRRVARATGARRRR